MKCHYIISLILLSCIPATIFAQANTCQVIPEALKGTYTGDCAEGKANGNGKAVGKDTYEGEFKNGYPDGSGTYKWQDNEYYTGIWKKGMRNGNGEMHYITHFGTDSTVKGFWKKDKYMGRFEKPYEVLTTTSKINKVDLSISNRTGRDINITIHQMNAGITTVNNISVMAGTYYRKSDQRLSNSSVTRIQDVTYPFRAIFYLSNGESADILFNESGDYEVYMDIL